MGSAYVAHRNRGAAADYTFVGWGDGAEFLAKDKLRLLKDAIVMRLARFAEKS